MQSKNIKMHYQKTPSIGRNVSDLFYVQLCIHNLPNLRKNFWFALTYDSNVEYKVSTYWFNLFLSYEDNNPFSPKQTNKQTNKQITTTTTTTTTKNQTNFLKRDFLIQNILNNQNVNLENLIQKHYFLYHVCGREKITV